MDDSPRVVDRRDVSRLGRAIRVERLTVSAQQVSSVTTALQTGKSLTGTAGTRPVGAFVVFLMVLGVFVVTVGVVKACL